MGEINDNIGKHSLKNVSDELKSNINKKLIFGISKKL